MSWRSFSIGSLLSLGSFSDRPVLTTPNARGHRPVPEFTRPSARGTGRPRAERVRRDRLESPCFQWFCRPGALAPALFKGESMLIELRNVEKTVPQGPTRSGCCAGSTSTSRRASSSRSWARRGPASRRCSTSWACTTAPGPASTTCRPARAQARPQEAARSFRRRTSASSSRATTCSTTSRSTRTSRSRSPTAT